MYIYLNDEIVLIHLTKSYRMCVIYANEGEETVKENDEAI